MQLSDTHLHVSVSTEPIHELILKGEKGTHRKYMCPQLHPPEKAVEYPKQYNDKINFEAIYIWA